MRTRSPRIAPPLNGLIGSTASTPDLVAGATPARPTRRSVSVDLPAPGAPVMPTVPGPSGLRVQAAATAATASSPPASTSEMSLGDRTPITGDRARRRAAAGSSRHASRPARHSSATTSVMPGTRSMMIRSTPALRVIIETGQVPHAPTRLDVHDAVVVDAVEDDVAAVALQRGPDRVDRLEDVGLHAGRVERHPGLLGTCVRSLGAGSGTTVEHPQYRRGFPTSAARRGRRGARRRRRGTAGLAGEVGVAAVDVLAARGRSSRRRPPGPARTSAAPARTSEARTGAPDRRSTPRTTAWRPSVRTSAPMRASSSTNGTGRRRCSRSRSLVPVGDRRSARRRAA